MRVDEIPSYLGNRREAVSLLHVELSTLGRGNEDILSTVLKKTEELPSGYQPLGQGLH